MTSLDIHNTVLPEDIDISEGDDIDMGIDINNLLDEFFVTRMRVVALERENAELQGKVENLQRWKEQIEHVMMDSTINDHSTSNVTKKEKASRQKTQEQQCFINYCDTYKKDASTMSRVATKMTALGYSGIKKVPWSIMKLELKKMYENLSDEDKIKYLVKSRTNQ